MRPQLTGLWRHPDFLKLWIGQTVSLFGSQITSLALPLTAVLTLQATPGQMGMLRAASITRKHQLKCEKTSPVLSRSPC